MATGFNPLDALGRQRSPDGKCCAGSGLGTSPPYLPWRSPQYRLGRLFRGLFRTVG